MPRLAPLLLASLLALLGCASPPPSAPAASPDSPASAWDGSIQRWGTLHAVLREGETAGRVDIRAVTTPSTHGVGAMAELAGEILIADGSARISKGTDFRVNSSSPLVTSRNAEPGDQAAFLVTAEVPRWRTVEIDRRLDEKGLAELVRKLLKGTPFAKAKVVPLRVEGHFTWEGHVIAGICPHSAPIVTAGLAEAGPALPIEVRATAHSPTTLVGFLSDLPPGEIAHHGTRFHLHALHGDYTGGGQVAHVDSFAIEPGAVLSLPAAGRSGEPTGSFARKAARLVWAEHLSPGEAAAGPQARDPGSTLVDVETASASECPTGNPDDSGRR